MGKRTRSYRITDLATLKLTPACLSLVFSLSTECAMTFVLYALVGRPGIEVIKLFLCSAQPRLKFVLLINIKMPTIFGILAIINRINYRL